MERRRFLQGLTACLGTLRLNTASPVWRSNREHANFMEPVPGGRKFADISEARAAGLVPGDEVLVRDLGTIASDSAWSRVAKRGKWQLRSYRLADKQTGQLLL